jgi:hypothetical protein
MRQVVGQFAANLFQAPDSVSSTTVNTQHVEFATKLMHTLQIVGANRLAMRTGLLSPVFWLLFLGHPVQLLNCCRERAPY